MIRNTRLFPQTDNTYYFGDGQSPPSKDNLSENLPLFSIITWRLVIIGLFAGGLMMFGDTPQNSGVYSSSSAQNLDGQRTYRWLQQNDPEESIASRIMPPAGFQCISVAGGSFAAWLRGLPLLPGHPPVKLYNGDLKTNQAAHYAVIEIDTGTSNLQQCADAVIRLRAEYLYAVGDYSRIHFDFTSGFTAAYPKWAEGYRIAVQDKNATWVKRTGCDYSYPVFRRYLNQVFVYAGTWSLAREIVPVPLAEMAIGDVLIQGGFPGHAVIVVNMAVGDQGQKVFLLAQSFMPAQQLHVLCNPANQSLSPWFPLNDSEKIVTPEWVFHRKDLKRFRD